MGTRGIGTDAGRVNATEAAPAVMDKVVSTMSRETRLLVMLYLNERVKFCNPRLECLIRQYNLAFIAI